MAYTAFLAPILFFLFPLLINFVSTIYTSQLYVRAVHQIIEQFATWRTCDGGTCDRDLGWVGEACARSHGALSPGGRFSLFFCGPECTVGLLRNAILWIAIAYRKSFCAPGRLGLLSLSQKQKMSQLFPYHGAIITMIFFKKYKNPLALGFIYPHINTFILVNHIQVIHNIMWLLFYFRHNSNDLSYFEYHMILFK
jgi:hypothetical protein